MARYNTKIPIGCNLYNEDEETQEHLFFKCKYAKNIWENKTAWLKVQCPATSSQEWCDYLLHIPLARAYKDIIYSMFTATVYYIWKARNDLKHKGTLVGWRTAAYSIKEQTRQRVLCLAYQTKKYRKYIDMVINRG